MKFLTNMHYIDVVANTLKETCYNRDWNRPTIYCLLHVVGRLLPQLAGEKPNLRLGSK